MGEGKYDSYHQAGQEESEELQTGQRHTNPWESGGASSPDNISRHMKERKMDGNSQREFMKEKCRYEGAKKKLV